VQTECDNPIERISINGTLSPSVPLNCGVPQGSVLGPVLFVIYLTGIGNIFDKYGISYKLYADDIQLYIVFHPSALASAVISLEQCIEEVRKWLLTNYLTLNASKTEVILFGRKRQIERTEFCGIKVDGRTIAPSQYVRDLGVIIDSSLTFERHIIKVCRTVFCNIHLINRLSRSMDLTMRTAAINALVLSHVDFCATLFYGLPKKQTSKLEHALRSAFRCIKQFKPRDSLSHLFKEHQWLTAQQRINLHTASFTYKIINHGRPLYLTELLRPLQETSYSLRSSDCNLLTAFRTKSVAGDRAFSIAAAKLWNSIPQNIRQSTNSELFKANYLRHLLTDG
jgi:hypothetical protein